uniref:Uncharacterized protein n=1 Tax=Alexandrium catenella TaxID=2925 RepID=A0A7S1R8I0_ALECA
MDGTPSEIYDCITRYSQALHVVPDPTILEVVFEHKSFTKAIAFNRRPLGLSLGNSMPVTVTKVSGQAAQLGVEVGWLVKSVGGERVAESRLPFNKVADALTAAALRLPYDESPPSFPMVFRDLCGQSRRVIFEQNPTGVRFARTRLPLTVSGVGAYAESLGVQEGWTVTSVAGTDITGPSFTYDDVESLLRRCVAPLPAQAKPKLDIIFAPDEAARRELDNSVKHGKAAVAKVMEPPPRVFGRPEQPEAPQLVD